VVDFAGNCVHASLTRVCLIISLNREKLLLWHVYGVGAA